MVNTVSFWAYRLRARLVQTAPQRMKGLKFSALGGIAKRPNASVCKTDLSEFAGSNPAPAICKSKYGVPPIEGVIRCGP